MCANVENTLKPEKAEMDTNPDMQPAEQTQPLHEADIPQEGSAPDETTEDIPQTQPDDVPPPVDAPQTDTPSQAPAEIRCPQCGSVSAFGTSFCTNCGKDLRALSVPAYPKKPPMSPEKKKQLRKKTLIVFIALVCVGALSIAGGFLFSTISRNSSLKRITQTVDAYKSESISYDTAVQVLNAMIGAKDEQVISEAKTAKQTVTKLKNSREHMQAALHAFEEEDYENAISEFSEVIKDDPNYTEAQEKMSSCLPLWKAKIPAEVNAMIKKGDTSSATELLDRYLKHDADTEISNIKDFLTAESELKAGNLNTAQDLYQKLPKKLTVNGVTVKTRLDTLSKYSFFVRMCGKWQTTKYYYETRETMRSGAWHNWYNDGTTANRYLYVRCVINSDGTVHVKGTATYRDYSNYSDYQSKLNVKDMTVDFNKKCSLPSNGRLSFSFVSGDITYGDSTITDNNTLTFDGTKFTFAQTMKYSASVYYRYNWKVDVTFGKQTEKF